MASINMVTAIAIILIAFMYVSDFRLNNYSRVRGDYTAGELGSTVNSGLMPNFSAKRGDPFSQPLGC
jgi:hypothetical protein